MSNEQREKRLMEAFAQHEAGVSLATLQTLFSDVSVELNQMIEAEQALKEGKVAMRLSHESGRKIIAAVALRQKQNQHSIFMAGFWRLAAPVGIATLSFMVILTGQHSVQPSPEVGEQVNSMAAKMAAPTVANDTDISLMLVPPEQGEGGAVDSPATEEYALRAAVGPDIVIEKEVKSDSLYLWQMITLGLLTILSIIVLIKHWQVRRRAL